ncbi:hypothetical protein BABINDRAFT_161103 [Babjeviella inositovora NRRL Y-12698]|uniref:Large ribosomal subunit protein mL38 n=1 Tax=Babjeviella inositovora NRRL Y-12698 TaxID=984486 RepID=A0A1E3QRJ4_9ASCO|nr:uncharacterized protein BABINDRAFT_161103 [Babjeviella inositovora NRRL Y-12698]ODQ80114.1 hypothetical protein BABINDRAFT_161103 [Babjeviella inositovora NRRL Y-12698]
MSAIIRRYSTVVTKADLWADFSKRSASLGLKDAQLKEALLKGVAATDGPVSITDKAAKMRYASTPGMQPLFETAHTYLQQRAQRTYAAIERIERQISETTDAQVKANLLAQKNKMAVSAEQHNPEVKYTAEYLPENLDMSQAAFRHYAEQKWNNYGKMLLMERLETMSVIPDTMPTLNPEVDVTMEFPCSGASAVVPGAFLHSSTTMKPPTFTIQEFKETDNQLYTILIVNPDTPNVETNGFNTTLHWGLTNVLVSNTDIKVDFSKMCDAFGNNKHEICPYLPPVPEKNLPYQRFAVWVFRQEAAVAVKSARLNNPDFDIREFAQTHGLTAVGAHMWRSKWDRSVSAVREFYNLPKGRIFHPHRL